MSEATTTTKLRKQHPFLDTLSWYEPFKQRKDLQKNLLEKMESFELQRVMTRNRITTTTSTSSSSTAAAIINNDEDTASSRLDAKKNGPSQNYTPINILCFDGGGMKGKNFCE